MKKQLGSPEIFLSYAPGDLEVAREVYKAVVQEGFEVWFAEVDIPLGSSWRQARAYAWDRADIFLVIVGEMSFEKGGHRREILEARSADKTIVPLFKPSLPPLPAPLSFLNELRGIQLDSPSAMDDLLSGLLRLRGRPSAAFRGGVSLSISAGPTKLRVRRLHLEKIRCFESLDLVLSSEASWVSVLGDNAAGKSTVLRSLALGLCNEADAAALIQELPGGFVREGASEGIIGVELEDLDEGKRLVITTRVKIDASGDEIVRKQTRPEPFPWSDVFVCGYGTNRSREAHAGFESYSVREAVRTLFDDEASLQNPELVLLRQSPDLRQEIEDKVLRVLMLDDPDYRLSYPRTGPEIRGPWGRQPVSVLSDGYRSTMQWVLDFIGWGIYAGRFDGSGELGGILLIDELEQHLHPTWQRHIVERLRRQFPETQIFATTHTPLLAAAAADFDDAVVVRLKARGREPAEMVVVDREELKGLRADQVLASEAFGLVTSRSPGSVDDLDRFAELRGKEPRTAGEEAELEKLAVRLRDALRFGESPFEQQVEAAVDKALDDLSADADPDLLDLETKRQLRALFRGEPTG